MAPQNAPFTAFSGTNAPDTRVFNSMMESLMADSSTRRPPPTAVTTSASPTESTSAANTSNSPAPSTLSTVPSSSQSSNSPSVTPTSAGAQGSSATSSGAGSSVTSAASTTDNGLTQCSGISCSPGLRAAVAVPVVVGVLAIFALAFFLVRKKRKTARGYTSSQEKPKKGWTRHLRIFSFDAELIGSGRFSSSNSMRSGQSLHGQTTTHNRENPSIHSIDDVAPPYRDAVSHVHQPSMSQTGQHVAAGTAGTAGGLAAGAMARSASRASAPPPYGVTENRPPTAPTTPVSAARNPFSDPNPISPVDVNSPFRDPSDDGRSLHSRPTISRNSSTRTGPFPDDFSVVGGSEAGSIREAQVARHVSIASGGRTIANVRNSSQSPPNQTPPNAD